MHAEPPLSKWALTTFGERAGLVRRTVAESIFEAIGNGQDAQKAAGTGKQHPFGFTLMSRKFETLDRAFEDMADVTKVRPRGSIHNLTVVSGNLLFPFCFAKDRSVNVMKAQIGGDNKLSGLLHVLFALFGPERTIEQLTIIDTGDDEESARLAAVADSLARLPEGTKLVLVAYACNSQAGLLEIWWGEAELLDKQGNLKWHQCEEIPLPKAPPADGQLPGSIGGPTGSPNTPRFDEGPMPTPPLNPRPSVERQNEDAFPPNSEAESPMQDAADDEGT